MYQLAVSWVQVPLVEVLGYRNLTIRPKDAAVWGDRVTPNMAIYAFFSAIMTNHPKDHP